jgi:hypothetical protein
LLVLLSLFLSSYPERSTGTQRGAPGTPAAARPDRSATGSTEERAGTVRSPFRITPIRLLLGASVLAFLLMLAPAVQRRLDRARAEGTRSVSRTELLSTLGPGRVTRVYAFIGILLAGSLFDVAMDTEHWPFSQYAMYSETLTSRSLDTLRLVGVPRDGTAPVPLYASRFIDPFNQSRIRWAFEKMIANGGSQSATLHDAVGDCLQRYEWLRKHGRHAGPPLGAMRLYRFYWTLSPDARNVDLPDRQELIVEVRSQERAGR